MQDHARALDVAKEIVPQPGAFRSALNQPGNIRRNEALFIVAHNAQIGRKGCEVVIGDLGLCRRNLGKKGTLAHVREADEADVCNDLHLEDHRVRLGELPFLREVGRVAARRGEAHVALAPSSARENAVHFAVLIHVADDLARIHVANQGAARNFHNNVCTALPKALVGAAALAVSRKILRDIAERKQIVHVLIADEIDVSAISAVAAIRPARRLALVRLEGVHAISPVARLDRNFYLIRKAIRCHSKSIADFYKTCNDFLKPCAHRKIYSDKFV